MGWWMVAASAICMMVGSGLTIWALGVYVRPLEQEFGWSRAEVSAATSIVFLIAGITGPISGAVTDRSGVRPPILLGALGLAGSLALISQVQTLWQLYVLYGLMAFSRAWVHYIPFLRLVARWFPDRMGAPVGVMGIGFSAAALVFVPAVTVLEEAAGWRGSLLVSAALVLGIIFPVGLLLRAPAGPLRPTVAQPPKGAPQDFTLSRALRSAPFWHLCLALGLFYGNLMSFNFHTVPIYLARGLDPGEAALWVGVMSALTTVIRFGLGYLVDRSNRLRPMAVVSGATPAAGLLVLAFTSGTPGIVAFVLLFSVGSAIGPLMESVLIIRTFGTASFGAILGAVGVAETVGSVVGPYVGGALYDATGSYTAALLIYAAGFAVCAASFMFGRYRDSR